MCEFIRDYEESSGCFHNSYEQFLKEKPSFDLSKKRLTEAEILNNIREGKITGFIHADFNCPEKLRARFELFPLFFKKVYIDRQDTGPIMSEYLEKMGLLKTPSLELISSHFGLGASNSDKFSSILHGNGRGNN